MTLVELLREEIAARGPIPFRDFMERALYHLEHGYYASGRARIGRGGDYFTNVSVGPLFGTLLALQFDEMWRHLGSPERFTIVEQGAHDGRFAVDALSALHLHSPVLHERLSYVIVEPSPRARARQRQMLGAFADDAQWVDSVTDLPLFTGVHFSNELIDAFPVHRVKWTGAKWVERCVGWRDGAFAFADGALSAHELASCLEALPPVPAGYETEINLAAREWVALLATKLARGYVLAIDYGFPRDEYFRSDRTGGTLAAYSSHRRAPDPLDRPGEIDLTAHVDFTSLTEAAEDAGLALNGFTDQHHFFVGSSRLHFGEAAPSAQDLRAFKTLMHPELLGRSFKALCLSKAIGGAPALSGFSFASDGRKTLGLRQA